MGFTGYIFLFCDSQQGNSSKEIKNMHQVHYWEKEEWAAAESGSYISQEFLKCYTVISYQQGASIKFSISFIKINVMEI